MNKVILHYLLKGFIQKFLIVVGVFYCFGLILNLFEEVEFFQKFKCKSTYTINAYQYLYSKPNNKSFTFCNFYFQSLVYACYKR